MVRKKQQQIFTRGQEFSNVENIYVIWKGIHMPLSLRKIEGVKNTGEQRFWCMIFFMKIHQFRGKDRVRSKSEIQIRGL